MKILMSYSLGKDVSTVVRDVGTAVSTEYRRAFSNLALKQGVELRPGDIWNGKEVTEAEAKVFFRPSHVSFIEG